MGLMEALKGLLLALAGFGSGFVIAGAVFAFIAVVGLIPRMAQKTHTQGYVKLYEEAVMAGGLFGALTILFDYNLPIGAVAGVLALCIGVFYGCVAISLAEVLDVIPIMTRRTGLAKGLKYFILALALGKMAGSVAYFLIPGFTAG